MPRMIVKLTLVLLGVASLACDKKKEYSGGGAEADADTDGDTDGDADADCEPDTGFVDLCHAHAKLLAGDAMAAAGDVDLDGFDDILVGSTAAADDGVASAWLVHGPVTGTVPDDQMDVRLAAGRAYHESTISSVAIPGDVNGDGWPDALVGDDNNCEGGYSAGMVYLVLGPFSGTMALEDADVRWIGAAGEGVGEDVTAAGDVDGDGLPEILVGAPFAYSEGEMRGGAFLILEPELGDWSLEDAGIGLYGEAEYDGAGRAVAGGGDLDGDGRDDFLVGAMNADTGGEDVGAAYVFHSLPSASMNIGGADVVLMGEDAEGWAGFSLDVLGDANGDGLEDIVIGDPAETTRGEHGGAAYLLLGPLTADMSLRAAHGKVVAEKPGDQAGFTVSGAGDVDGDGKRDFLVGAWCNHTNGYGAGAAYLLFGPVCGTQSLTRADAKFVGERMGDGAGFAVSGAGDVDGDVRADLLILAQSESTGGNYAGATYLLLGSQGQW